ncbi:MAG: hypothetical protein RI897_3092 [Verrucomicrobiota bacterium]
MEIDGGQVISGGELPVDGGGAGVGDPVDLLFPGEVFDLPEFRAGGFDADGGLQVEDIEHLEEAVVAHVAEGAGAEVAPAAEDGVGIGGVVGAVGDGAEPEVPIEAIGDGWGFGGEGGHALGPEGSGGPVMDFADGADGTGGEPFTDERGG